MRERFAVPVSVALAAVAVAVLLLALLPAPGPRRPKPAAESESEPLGRPGLGIELSIEPEEWAELRSAERAEAYRDTDHTLRIRFGQGRPRPATYQIRGRTSLRRAFRSGRSERLNYGVDLHRFLPFGDGLALRRFYLQNLIYDPWVFEMRFSYRLLAELGLFPAHNQLVALEVNGQAVGLYLLVERPQDAIRRHHPGVAAIYRRAYTAEGRPDRPRPIYVGLPEAGRAQLDELRRLVDRERGEVLVAGLERVLDLDAYLRWIAFNALVRNADSWDELFLFSGAGAGGPAGRLGLMAWDYDDILEPRPAHRALAVRDPLLFGCEDPLDRRIHAEPVLYERYRRTLRTLLTETLPATRLRDALNETLQEVDGLSTGLPPGEESAWKSARRGAFPRFESELLGRHAELLARLDAAAADRPEAGT